MFTFLIFVIFLVLVIFSFFIEDSNLKLCYWLVILLFALTIFNIILSITYYTKLRNEPGIPGPRGPQGARGSKGPGGKCRVSDKCNINEETCNQRLVDMAHEIFPHIRKECISNVGRCNSSEQSLGRPLAKQIENLTQKCYTTNMAEPDFMKSVRPSLVRLQEDGDIS